MSLNNMTLMALDDTGAGGWYNTKLTTSGISPIFRLPVQPIMAIGTTISGNGYLDFSVSALDDLATGSGIFYPWDGVARINPAVTGFRLVSVSGLVTANVTVKTFYAS